MPIRPAPPAGARAPTRSLRIIVALLAALQLAAPVAALAADQAPTASHVDHIGAPDDACHTFHDELFCLSCRVVAEAPVGPHAGAVPGPPLTRAEHATGSATARLPTSNAPDARIARAPPLA